MENSNINYESLGINSDNRVKLTHKPCTFSITNPNNNIRVLTIQMAHVPLRGVNRAEQNDHK